MFLSKTWKLISVIAGLAGAQHACALDHPFNSASLEFATGSHVQMARVGLQINSKVRWFESNNTYLGVYYDFTFAHWRINQYQNIPGALQNFGDIGITPVFRFQHSDQKGLYGEGAIGVHRLSQLYNNDGRRLSTRFQFGDHIGIGYVFANGWDVGVKIQHFSNGGYKKPNSGVNFAEIKAGFAF